MIDVESLTKTYGDFQAVRGMTFHVAPGEVLGLVGPNGAGKTTTLRSIAGIIVPTSGSVRVGGNDMATAPQKAKALLAFIPDEPQLFEHLTVEEHLRFIGRLYGVADAPARIEPLLIEMELLEKRGVLPAALSRGMRQKLAIACGLLHSPSALLLDEPLTGLDPAGMRRMKSTIAARARAGAAVVLSSHLLHLVEELCTRLLVMQRGRVIAIGTLAEIVAERPDLAGRALEDVFLALIDEGERQDDRAERRVNDALRYLLWHSARNRMRGASRAPQAAALPARSTRRRIVLRHAALQLADAQPAHGLDVERGRSAHLHRDHLRDGRERMGIRQRPARARVLGGGGAAPLPRSAVTIARSCATRWRRRRSSCCSASSIWVVLLRRGGTSLPFWMRAISLWIILSTLYLHRVGASLVRTSAVSHGRRGRAYAMPFRSPSWRR